MMNGFNPRTREGATFDMMTKEEKKLVSIHAPVRVRLSRTLKEMCMFLFQSTHP